MRAPSLPDRIAWSARLAATAPVAGTLPYSRSRIERSSHGRLRAMVDHAHSSVPHYRQVFDDLGLEPAEIRSAADLARLPLLEREQLQRDPGLIVSTAFEAGALIELRTGGSSGAPVTVHHDVRALFDGAAAVERRRRIYMREAGKRLRLRVLGFGTALGTAQVTRLRFARSSLIPRGLRVKTELHSMLDPLEDNVERIERFRPDVVGGFGSYLEALMEHISDRGGIGHRPAAVVYGGDAISERGRRRIPAELGIPVFSAYGAVEAFHIGFECEEHRGLHINTDLYPVRIVDSAGSDVPEGSSGEVVVSNLVNRGSVLLNYRLGDVAHWVGEPCPCGRQLPLLSYLEGRVDDWIELAGGGLLHPQSLRILFTDEGADVRAYQIEQRSAADLVVRIVPAPGRDPAEREQLEGRLRAGFRAAAGPATEVSFDYVDELPRTERGKVRTVLSPGSRRRAASISEPIVRPARPGELDRILAVMEPANMHRRESPEMPPLELDRFTVAELDGEIVGAAGWELLEPEIAKTTLLAVLPSARGHGIGELLQRARMAEMVEAGASRVRTNADRPATIAWYRRLFGYEEVGRLAKVDDFGDPEVDVWTTLEAPLNRPRASGDHPSRPRG